MDHDNSPRDGTTDHETTSNHIQRVIDRVETPSTSRRRFLTASAVGVGAGTLGLTGLGGAQETDEDGADGEDSMGNSGDVPYTDVDVLNYALTLERLEDAFYAQARENISMETLRSSETLSGFGDRVLAQVNEYIHTVGEHESVHTDQLMTVVEVLGAEPPADVSYDFGFGNDPDAFLELATVFENTGVAAYAGAAPRIESPDLLSAALSIHSVEARHASYLNLLTGAVPFPNAFDPAQSMDEVLEAVGPFIAAED